MQTYQPKSKIRRDCNQCVCAYGKWVCTKNTCDGVCRTYGDRCGWKCDFSAMLTFSTEPIKTYFVNIFRNNMMVKNLFCAYCRHYESFDGAEFNFRADQDCSYILARSSGVQDISFEIVIENHHCTWVGLLVFSYFCSEHWQ